MTKQRAESLHLQIPTFSDVVSSWPHYICRARLPYKPRWYYYRCPSSNPPRMHRPSVTLSRHGREYVARYAGHPVNEAFEQDTLPTAFTAEADSLDVLRAVTETHPECDVILAPASPSVARHRTSRRSFRGVPSMS